MWLQVDPRAPTPVYQQIVDGVKAAVAAGWLAPGDRLPSVRDLAVALAVNHNTVAKAYQELERSRVIEVIRGRGTFVTRPSRTPPDAAERMEKLRDALRLAWIEAYHLGLTDAEFERMFHQAGEAARGRADMEGV
ncbi:GntR family transcriptional regulator [Alicyclobacillus vulcanalis]|uniref:GntR family transcriptional regulator n=1 Tax=Alicyclobacillus vulcanalis TaxID=252246 RepID=A0A1N7NYU4_9BACL|nr:GntR family transcriptional regulator [Alicyclobacillus vulcanalis]SIT03535.1 GntR family transcriptional regulator [Alicyclobacillus vulcanalis]